MLGSNKLLQVAGRFIGVVLDGKTLTQDCQPTVISGASVYFDDESIFANGEAALLPTAASKPPIQIATVATFRVTARNGQLFPARLGLEQ
ncbi:MAG: hypothetical protein M1835_001268 [Candelina submexicana]|nr:MAG: hypothetical protein M1835_001268 [Candelina submexicana]